MLVVQAKLDQGVFRGFYYCRRANAQQLVVRFAVERLECHALVVELSLDNDHSINYYLAYEGECPNLWVLGLHHTTLAYNDDTITTRKRLSFLAVRVTI